MEGDSFRKARLASVIAATALALACGTNYAYSAWAPDFAKHMEITTTQSNVIGAAGNFGAYAMGVPAGILIDSRGPRLAVIIGAICLASGYWPVYNAYIQGPGSMSVPMLCFFYFLTGAGSCTAFSAAIKTSAYNWPLNRGTATAFPLSAFGLSAFFFTSVAHVVFAGDTSSYLLMLAAGTVILAGGSVLFIRLLPSATGADLVRETNKMKYRSIATNDTENDVPAKDGDEIESLVSSRPSTSEDVRPFKDLSSVKQDQQEITGLKVLKTLEFWQLFVVFSLLSGVGLMTINNIGNDAGALWRAFSDTTSPEFVKMREQMHVGILSVGSFCGRLISGIGSDYLIRRLHASRLWCLVGSGIVFAIAQFLALVTSNPNYLFLVSSLTGVGYGALFGVFPALVADAFGAQGLALNWGLIIFAPVFTGNLFNVMYGRIFDSHVREHPAGPDGDQTVTECTDGLGCYASAYWLTLASSVAGVVLALWIIRYKALRVGRAHGREA